MKSPSAMKLLGADDPPPVGVINPAGASAFLFVGDHAGLAIPRRLGTLGLGSADLGRHIACDFGVRELGEALASQLDAVFVHQIYSRLVIDCNRDPSSIEAIAEVSDGTPIPANIALASQDVRARIDSIHRPYHRAIAAELRRRRDAGLETILVALHSFTPQFQGDDRPWAIGVLHDKGESSFARSFLEKLGREKGLIVGDNEPYRMDATDYTVPCHAYPGRISYVELEVRQDLIATSVGQIHCASLLTHHLNATLDFIQVRDGSPARPSPTD